MQGDAAWSLIIATTQSEAEQYLTSRASLGFNIVLVNLIDHQFAPNAPANMAGNQPFTGQHRAFIDPPNEAYFAYADWVINRADQLGLYVMLDPSYMGFGGGDEGFYQDMVSAGPTKMRQWGEYVGNRYKDFTNIIWVEGGDFSPPASGKELVNQVALGIEEFSSCIQTAHQQREDSAEDIWGSYPWLDLNNTYTSELTYPNSLNDFNRTPITPTFLIEDIYENEHGLSQLLGRASKYWNVLSGSTGALMGNSPIWGFDYNLDFSNLGSWTNWLNSQLSTDMSRLGSVFSSRPWYKLVPDQNHTVVTAGYGSFGNTNYVTVCERRRHTRHGVHTVRPHADRGHVQTQRSGDRHLVRSDQRRATQLFPVLHSPIAVVETSRLRETTAAETATGFYFSPRTMCRSWTTPETMSLNGILQGATGNGGTKIVDLIASAGGDRITDGNAGAVEGIAVTAADTTNGSWQYSLDDGANWKPLGPVSATNARLLAADANTRVRFVPSAAFHGTISVALTFRAWDRTAGVNGGMRTNTNSNGGSTTFSTATETASIVVTPGSTTSGSPFAVGTPAGTVTTVTMFNADRSVRFTAQPFGPSNTGGARVAVGDVTGDGVADIVAVTLGGTTAQAKVIDGATETVLPGSIIGITTYTGPVSVAVGDLTGDGVAEITIGTNENGARARVFRGGDYTLLSGFHAGVITNFVGRTNVAMADMNGDGKAELVVTSLYTNGSRVVGYRGSSLAQGSKPTRVFNAFMLGGSYVNGLFLALGDVNADGSADLVLGSGVGSVANVAVFSGQMLVTSNTRAKIANFTPANSTSATGVKVATRDVDGDGKADILISSGELVTALKGGSGLPSSGQPPELFEFDPNPAVNGAVWVG